MKFGGYTGVTLFDRTSVCLSIHLWFTKSCQGHNFESIKASNFKLHTQTGHIVEKCSVQEPQLFQLFFGVNCPL